MKIIYLFLLFTLAYYSFVQGQYIYPLPSANRPVTKNMLQFKPDNRNFMQYLQQQFPGLIVLSFTSTSTCSTCMICQPCQKPGWAGINLFNPYTGNVHREIRDLEVWGGVGDEPMV